MPCSLSDLDFVQLDLSLGNFTCPRGGVWKVNTSLLSDDDPGHLGDVLTLILNEAFRLRSLTGSHREGLLRLL